MSQPPYPAGYHEALEFSLFIALQGRRSRRFSLGAEIPDGPLAYASKQEPTPLNPIEKELILGAVAGNTGWHYMIPWNEATALSLPRFSASAGGRSFPSAVGWHTTDFFFTDDMGVYYLSTRDAHPIEHAQTLAEASQGPIVQAERSELRRLYEGRLNITQQAPHVSPHNRWSFNRPGSLVIFPVSDVAQYVFDRVGKFPGTAPTMAVRTFLKAHHLDLEFYNTFYQSVAYLQTHATHMEKWHS